MIKSIFWCLTATVCTLSAADPAIYFSMDKTTRADYGGTGTKATVAGLKDPSGVGSRLLVQKGRKKYRADDLLRDGISGKAFPIGKQQDGAILTLKYQPEPRIKAAEGSISFWVRPENWNGDEKKNFRHFVSARQGDNWFIIYKNNESTDILVYYGNWKARKTVTTVRYNVRSWKKGEWHHIGVSWNKNALVLYVDGRQRGTANMKQISPEDFGTLFFGEYWKGDPGQTLLDEVRIFDQYLTDKEMTAEFTRFAEKLAATRGAPVEIGVSEKNTVKVDGIIGADEYSAVIGGMRDLQKKNVFASSQAVCRFAWDKENLYIAVSSPERKRIAKLSGRDSAVYTDDSVELYLKTPAGLYQFVVNPAGTLLDSKNDNVSWNAAGFKTKSSFRDGIWHWEAAVPWKDIGMTAKAGTRIHLNLARNYADSKENTQLAPCRRAAGYKEAAAFAELVCLEKGMFFDFSELGDLPHGKLNANLKISSAEKGKCHLRLAVDSSMFPVEIDRNLDLEPGKMQSFKFKRSIPDNNTLQCRLGIPERKITLYRANLDYSEPEAMRKWYIYTDLKKAELVFVMRAAVLNSGKTQMKLDFVAPDGKVAKSMTILLSDKEPVVEARFPLAGLPAGRYELRYTVQDASGKTFITDSEEYEYFKNGAYWDGIRDGLERTVPAPWTPVSGKGAEFNCWGRRVLFGSGGMIASIRSQGKELLKRPVSLKVNGKAVSFQARCISADPVSAVFELKPDDPKIPLTVKAVCEFDGFMYFSCSSPADMEIGTVALEIPLERKYTDAFDDCASPHYKNSLKKDTVLNVNAFTNPFFWCGGDEVGMMGGTATKRGWHVKDKSGSMTVAAGKQEVLLTLRIADRPFRTGPKGNVFSFYLNPTPVKPLKKFTEPPRERGNIIIGGTSSRFFMYYHPDYGTDFWKWIRARVKQDKRIHPDKMTYFTYVAPKGVSPMSPAWNYYCIDWVNPPPGLGEYSSDQARAGRIARNLNSFTYGCLNSKSFYDHQLMCVRNVLDGTKWKQDDVKHLYFDLCWPRSCGNASHGCRWKDEFGDTVRDNDLLRLREYFIRVLRMVRRKSPDGWLWGHIFPSRTPSDNFFDLIVGGEMYDSKVYKQVSYYDVLDPELVRIAYGTRCVEMTTALIPQFLRSLECFAPARKKYWDPNDPKHDRAIRHFIAYTSLFGLIQCFDIWDRRQRLLPQGKGQVDIWHQTLKVLGGSPARKYLGPVKPGVYAGSFTGNGKMLLIILNDTDKEQIVVCPAGGKTAVGQDIFSRKSYAAQNGRVECRLAPRDSVFILWK